MSALSFTLLANDGRARAGLLRTPHGDVPTPAFMPVGTQATVKTLTPDDLHAIGARMILANTYHLYLRPGIELIERMGGLHRFMGWDGPILTDSGGFQVFSLGHLRKLNDEGVTFRSHIDGSEHTLTPETVVRAQEGLGSDIAMVLDHCPAFGESTEEIKIATERTTRWAERCLKAQQRPEQALFGIVQGGWSAGLRSQSAREIAALGFPGNAIGGVSVGEPKQLGYQAIDDAEPHLPTSKPRYLMGVGSPDDLLNGIARGIDMFDCALPTRVARNGALFTTSGRVNIKAAQFRELDGPIDARCACYTCQRFTAAYLHHLFRAEELLYFRLATLHNLRFILRLMEQARAAIVAGIFAAFSRDFLNGYQLPDEETRMAQRDNWIAARQARAEAEEERA